MPTLRSWSAAVLATATDVGSLAATPITSVSWLAVLADPAPVVGGGEPGVGGGTGLVDDTSCSTV